MSYEVQNFQEDVIEASSDMPVLVDFWAEWCGPCRILGPVLEKLAAEQRGKWKLVKVDTDQHPDLSARYGIRGIPAVKLFSDGEVLDEFTGALPEHAVRKWLEEAIPSEIKQLLGEAERLIAESDRNGIADGASHHEAQPDRNLESGEDASANGPPEPSAAQAILEEILATHSGHPVASGLLAQLLAFEDPDRALRLAQTAASEPRFALAAESIARLSEVRSKIDLPGHLDGETGADHYLAASRALVAGKLDDTIASLIEVLKVNRYLDDDGARKTGVALFSLLGNAHPLTRKYRRTFDMWLY